MVDNMKIDNLIERELAEAGITVKIESHEDLIRRYRQDIKITQAMIVSIWSNYGPPCEIRDTDREHGPVHDDNGNLVRCPVCHAYEVIAWLEGYAEMWEEELAFADPTPDLLEAVRMVVEQPVTEPDIRHDLPSIVDIQTGYSPDGKRIDMPADMTKGFGPKED